MLRVLRTPPGSGKTLMSVSIAHLIQELNRFVESSKKQVDIQKQILV